MKTNYLKPSHPTFFASPAIVYDYYDKKIPLKKINFFCIVLKPIRYTKLDDSK